MKVHCRRALNVANDQKDPDMVTSCPEYVGRVAPISSPQIVESVKVNHTICKLRNLSNLSICALLNVSITQSTD